MRIGIGAFLLILFGGVGCVRGGELLSQQDLFKACELTVALMNDRVHLAVLAAEHHQPTRAAQRKAAFICDICKRTYSSKGNLKQHRRTHAPERSRVPCSYLTCSGTFARKSVMNEHVKRVHQRVPYDRKYRCELCNASFTKNYNLSRHRGTGKCRRWQKVKSLNLLATVALIEAERREKGNSEDSYV